MRVEKLEIDELVYTHAVYYTDANGCAIKFLCVAIDELDAYQQASKQEGANNVIWHGL